MTASEIEKEIKSLRRKGLAALSAKKASGSLVDKVRWSARAQACATKALEIRRNYYLLLDQS
jgi:hypothetical protein